MKKAFLFVVCLHCVSASFAQTKDKILPGPTSGKAASEVDLQRNIADQPIAPNKENIGGVSIGGASGIWMPTGKLSLVGMHPYIGCVVGGRGRKFAVDANFSVRFLPSRNTYRVFASDTVYNTSRFRGGYLGLDGTYELKKTPKNAFDALAGVAWDGIDALRLKSGSISRSINSLNLNMGIGYRFFLEQGLRHASAGSTRRRPEYRTTYLAIQAKFHYLNYQNVGGTPLTGNAFTVGLIYGMYARSTVNLVSP